MSQIRDLPTHGTISVNSMVSAIYEIKTQDPFEKVIMFFRICSFKDPGTAVSGGIR
jgi:hypothetical protein